MFRAISFVLLSLVAVALCGCPNSLSTGDPLSPGADVRITGLSTPGGEVLAPIVSSGQSGATTGAASAEFPQVGVNIAVFNGVSVTFTTFNISYFQEDGVTPLSVSPFGGFLTRFVPATFAPDGEPATATLRLTAVSADLRSFFAGADGLLGTSDDFPALAVAKITLSGNDINGNGFRVTTQLSITARPAAPDSGS